MCRRLLFLQSSMLELGLTVVQGLDVFTQRLLAVVDYRIHDATAEDHDRAFDLGVIELFESHLH